MHGAGPIDCTSFGCSPIFAASVHQHAIIGYQHCELEQLSTEYRPGFCNLHTIECCRPTCSALHLVLQRASRLGLAAADAEAAVAILASWSSRCACSSGPCWPCSQLFDTSQGVCTRCAHVLATYHLRREYVLLAVNANHYRVAPGITMHCM